MKGDAPRSLLAPRARLWVLGGVALLLAVALGLIAWRGPAILLDLSNLAALCF